MKAVILGGGIGSRLGNLTRFTPKSLLKIKNKTILEQQISQLKKSGISEIFINTHFLKKKFSKYIKKLKYSGVKINLKYQKKLNGTAGAVKIFDKKLVKEKYFFLIYGDILFKENLRNLLNFHKSRKSYISIYVHNRKYSNSIVEYSKKNGMIKSFYERPSKIKEAELINKSDLNNFGVNSSIYIINSGILKDFSKNDFLDFPKDIFPRLIKMNKMFASKTRKKRIAIDSIKQLNQARRNFI